MNSESIEKQTTKLNQQAKRRDDAIINAYKTGYFDCAAMFAMSDANVKEEMEIGLKDHLDFVQKMRADATQSELNHGS